MGKAKYSGIYRSAACTSVSHPRASFPFLRQSHAALEVCAPSKPFPAPQYFEYRLPCKGAKPNAAQYPALHHLEKPLGMSLDISFK